MKKNVMKRAWEKYRTVFVFGTHRARLSKSLTAAWAEVKALHEAQEEANANPAATADQMLTAAVENHGCDYRKTFAPIFAEKLGIVLDGRAITIKSDIVRKESFATLECIKDFIGTHFDCKSHGTWRALTFVSVEDREIKKRRKPGMARFMDSLAYGEKVAEMYADM